MIILIILLVLIVLSVARYSQQIVDHELKLYAVMSALQVLQLIYAFQPSWQAIQPLSAVLKPMINGTLATAIFIVVMFTGALDITWPITRKLRKVRKTLSIAASIAVMFHCLCYLYVYQRIELTILSTGLIAFIVMIPLFVTSFHVIKKKIGGKRFMRIQRWAYLFYAMVFLHIIFAKFKQRQIDIDGIALYILIFSVYTLVRLKKYLSKKSRTKSHLSGAKNS